MMQEKLYSIFMKGFKSLSMEEIGVVPFITVMFISLISALFISYLYLKFYKNRATGSQIHRAFPMLGVAVTAIFICIQFSLPLSLGLLGALSIVRFRTPIKEPEEIGFIMLVIATSICCATFNMLFLAILLAIACVGLVILKHGPHILKGRLNDGMILTTIPSGDYRVHASRILDFLEEKLPEGKIESILENQDDTAVSYSFVHLDKNRLLDIQAGLEDMAAGIKTNVFFNRQGEI